MNAKGYSTGQVLRVSNGLRVRKAGQKNSCPAGYKIWSPRSKEDWIIVFNALGQNIDNYPRKPDLIVDVTRPLDKCNGCDTNAMKSTAAHEDWWTTSDDSPWWLRDSVFHEPSDGYRANCYLSVYDVYPNHVKFNYGNCSFSSTEYLCQEKCKYNVSFPNACPPPIVHRHSNIDVFDRAGVPLYPGFCSGLPLIIAEQPSKTVPLLILGFVALTSIMSTVFCIVINRCRWPKNRSSGQTHIRTDSGDSDSPNPNDAHDPSINPHLTAEIELPVMPLAAVALDMSDLSEISDDDVIIPVAEISPRYEY